MQSDKVDSGSEEKAPVIIEKVPVTMPDDVKERINQLLWYALPGSSTIERADYLAIEVYDMIARLWDAAP